ncbi:MAG: hypothetical protein LBE02_03075 [Spirochaetaceae bacterium]|jgi:hypothetical protein|nr:hypothetical protein [Spirochaetaceae bacterium]
MLPVYFLSIAINVLVGLLFILNREDAKGVLFPALADETVRLGVGILAVITGFLKILSPVAGSIPVVGDLVPALANLAGGLILVFEFYRNRSTIASPAAEQIEKFVDGNRKLTGFICIIAAALHFIFSSILFL